jgi:hypothetical protein
LPKEKKKKLESPAPSSPPTKKGTERDMELELRKIIGKAPAIDHAQKIKKYCKELYAAGWKSMCVTYSGSGDSCSDFEFSIANEEEEFHFSDVTTVFTGGFTLKDVERELWELLPVGFENNEGGEGTIKITTKTGRIVVDHTTYYTESSRDVRRY